MTGASSSRILHLHPWLSRRLVLGAVASLPLFGRSTIATASRWTGKNDRRWPSDSEWNALGVRVNGQLAPIVMPELKGSDRNVANPYYLRDEPALTQSSGWVDAWQSKPSAYVLKAQDARQISEAINFARRHRIKLVIKGGGHSYIGGSNAADSLLIWTRALDSIAMHDGFVPSGVTKPPVPAVSVGAGCVWGEVYNAVTTLGKRYVQGGGCATVGVAGLVQGGGFGSYSKAYGLSAAHLLEAEVVTSDGRIRLVNERQDPELYWALKGGGGGTFGVVTRLTLATHPLPSTFGAANFGVRALSDEAFQALLDRFLAVYQQSLFNRHWGEQVQATPDNRLIVNMTFLDLSDDEARRAWVDLEIFVHARPQSYEILQPLSVVGLPGRYLWDARFLERSVPGLISRDHRPGAPKDNWWWTGDGEQAGSMWHGYSSLWLPQSLLNEPSKLVAAWFAASRDWPVSLHFNKGLAGGDPEAIEASRRTAMNPSALDAFALAIIAGGGRSSFAGLDLGPDFQQARVDARLIKSSMKKLRAAAPSGGAYVSECDFFLEDWRAACWGSHWRRLETVKGRYDPVGLFEVHHGIGTTDRS